MKSKKKEREFRRGPSRVGGGKVLNRKWDTGSLPSLKPLLASGFKLKGDGRTLNDVVDAAWLSRNRLRIVLREGRKRQVRRMVEEMLGMRASNPPSRGISTHLLC